jgi:hypothetical protein
VIWSLLQVSEGVLGLIPGIIGEPIEPELNKRITLGRLIAPKSPMNLTFIIHRILQKRDMSIEKVIIVLDETSILMYGL